MGEKDRKSLRHASAAQRQRDKAERTRSVATFSMTPTVPKKSGQHAAGAQTPEQPAQCGVRARRR